jgi:hypothetical protein
VVELSVDWELVEELVELVELVELEELEEVEVWLREPAPLSLMLPEEPEVSL